MAKLGVEPFYFSSTDFAKFAIDQIAEARRFVVELGLKQD